jgi:hypothetical protein
MGEWNDGTLEYWNNERLGLKAAKVVFTRHSNFCINLAF